MVHRSLLWISGITSAVAAAVYVLWGPSNRAKKKGMCRGLENLGNTCFMNVVLQAWAATPSVVTWLTKFMAKHCTYFKRPCLAQPLLHTIRVINNQEDEYGDVHSPADIIGALRSRRWVISHDQQDAHELFNVFTSTLDEESNKFPGLISLFDLETLEDPANKYQPPDCAITRTQGLLPVLPYQQSENPFRMLFASQLECVDCKYRHPVKYDLSDSMSLSFPKTAWKSIQLEVLLQKFISSEIVPDVECPGCKKIQFQKLKQSCNGSMPQSAPQFVDVNPKSSCLKRLTIGKIRLSDFSATSLSFQLPHCLCLHMQRTQWLDSGIPLKKYEKVIFPEILYMDDYMYTKCEKNSRNGLLGGKALFGNTVVPLPTQSPVVSPTSGHVTLLRALNYDSRISSRGLFLQSFPQQSSQCYSSHSDINHNSPRSQDYTYKLTAVVMHLGDVFSGHFVTYRRGVPFRSGERYGSSWLCVSDHAVKEVTLDEVMLAEAYMLFYERI